MYTNGPDVELYLGSLVFLVGLFFFLFLQWEGMPL